MLASFWLYLTGRSNPSLADLQNPCALATFDEQRRAIEALSFSADEDLFAKGLPADAIAGAPKTVPLIHALRAHHDDFAVAVIQRIYESRHHRRMDLLNGDQDFFEAAPQQPLDLALENHCRRSAVALIEAGVDPADSAHGLKVVRVKMLFDVLREFGRVKQFADILLRSKRFIDWIRQIPTQDLRDVFCHIKNEQGDFDKLRFQIATVLDKGTQQDALHLITALMNAFDEGAVVDRLISSFLEMDEDVTTRCLFRNKGVLNTVFTPERLAMYEHKSMIVTALVEQRKVAIFRFLVERGLPIDPSQQPLICKVKDPNMNEQDRELARILYQGFSRQRKRQEEIRRYLTSRKGMAADTLTALFAAAEEKSAPVETVRLPRFEAFQAESALPYVMVLIDEKKREDDTAAVTRQAREGFLQKANLGKGAVKPHSLSMSAISLFSLRRQPQEGYCHYGLRHIALAATLASAGYYVGTALAAYYTAKIGMAILGAALALVLDLIVTTLATCYDSASSQKSKPLVMG